MAADGTRFFYVNPLEASPERDRARADLEHVKTRRVEWFGCSCCPPNVARLVGSIGAYAYAYDESSIWVHNYVAGGARIPSAGGGLGLLVETDYPWEGSILIRIESGGGKRAFRLRVPSWSASFSARLNGEPMGSPRTEKGYLVVEREWRAGDRLELELDMGIRFLRARPEVAEAIGQVCAQRGPFALCAEEADNGPGLQRLEVDTAAPVEAGRSRLDCEAGPPLESLRVSVGGRRMLLPPPGARSGAALYGGEPPRYEDCRIVLLPYFQWANRAEGEMRVWLRSR
jgi:DUF1680 family protein